MFILRDADKTTYQRWARMEAGRLGDNDAQRHFMMVAYSLPFWVRVLDNLQFLELLAFTEELDIVVIPQSYYEAFIAKRHPKTL